jgi:hypothetical protein
MRKLSGVNHGDVMPEYHLYMFDQHGHIMGRKDLKLPDDQQAIAKAKQFVDGRAVELWSGTNLIARIDPQKEPETHPESRSFN